MIKEEKQVLEAWSNNTKDEIIAMFPQYDYWQIANFVSRHNKLVRAGKKCGAVFLKNEKIKSAANSIFTPEEASLLYEIYPAATISHLLKTFPGRTMEQIRDHIATRNSAIRRGKVKGRIILKMDCTQVKRAAREAEEGHREHIIPLKPVIDFDLYAYRMGYLLTTESRTSGSGVLESQSVRLKAA